MMEFLLGIHAILTKERARSKSGQRLNITSLLARVCLRKTKGGVDEVG